MNKTVIRPQHKWYDTNLGELWRYRDLYTIYVRRFIVLVYKQTILGPLWYLIQPILTTIMFMFVFGNLAGISTDGVPQPLFYLAGLLVWNYFSQVFTEISDLFVANSNVFGKVYFPRLIVPLAIATSNLLKAGIQAILFFAVYAFIVLSGGTSVNVNWTVVLIPFYILVTAILAISWGMLFSSLTIKYRDLKFLIAFGVQLFMYATPIIYPLSTAPEAYRTILYFNPLSSIVEAFRNALLGCGAIQIEWLLYSTVFAIASFAFSIIVFTRAERTFMDTV